MLKSTLATTEAKLAIDLTTLNEVVSDLTDALESSFSDNDAATGDLMALVEVLHADGKRGLRVVASKGTRRHVRLGLLQEAEIAEAGRMAAGMSKEFKDNIDELKAAREEASAVNTDARTSEQP
jgi:hypothetical protein